MELSRGIEIAPVRDDAALQEFLQLPWSIYRNDPYWVPPLLSQQRDFLDRNRGPFFEIGEAQYFLAWADGRPVGRISAHLNRLHDEHHGPETGFFGFFEATPDPQVAAALLEAAAAWLRSRGKTRLVGPLNFCIYDEMGLLVEGFDSLPAIFQTHNPPYYQELLTSWGLRPAMDWLALKITNRQVDLAAMEQRLEKILREQRVTMRHLIPGEIPQRADELFHLFNEAWEDNWGHVPLTRRQFDYLMHEIKPLLRQQLLHLILDGDRLVGFGIMLPDLNPLVKKLNGRLTLWGKLRLVYAAKFGPIRKVRGLVLGISQPYQAKRLHFAMILRSYIELVRDTPCEFADFSLIPTSLRHYIKAFEAFGARRYKVFRVFEREI